MAQMVGMATRCTMATESCLHLGRSSMCPPWLQAALADIERRVESLSADTKHGNGSDSFAECAEQYYRNRPQLLSLLRELHHRYLHLADRYAQSLHLSHRRNLSAATAISDSASGIDDSSTDCSSAASDVVSTLSYASFPNATTVDAGESDLDMVVAEFVFASVEREILATEMAENERKRGESTRKIDLQGCLLEVLESERMILLEENARLGSHVAAAEEEAAVMAAELEHTRRKAGEMAKLVVKLREEQKLCMLGKKAEALQALIYCLQRRNRDCLDAMAGWEKERMAGKAEMERLKEENRRLLRAAEVMSPEKGAKWRWLRGAPKVDGDAAPFELREKERKAAAAASWNCFC